MVRVRGLFGAATVLRQPRAARVGDEKRTRGADADVPFGQSRRAGMQRAVQDWALKQTVMKRKAAVNSSLKEKVKHGFENSADRVVEGRARKAGEGSRATPVGALTLG